MYFYHAYALAVGSTVKSKSFTEGDCALSTRGGTAHEDVTFDKHGIAFKAHSEVSGAWEKRNGLSVYRTQASVSIENLKIQDKFSAKSIKAQICAEEREGDYESSTVITGSEFHGVKVGDQELLIEMSEDMFERYATFSSMQADFKNSYTRDRVLNCMVGSGLRLDSDAQPDVKAAFNAFEEQKALPSLRQAVVCSLVKNVTNLPTGIRNWGPIISVPQFGTIYLGEVIVWPWMRCLTMFRIELVSGECISGGSGGTNGIPFPPGAYSSGGGLP